MAGHEHDGLVTSSNSLSANDSTIKSSKQASGAMPATNADTCEEQTKRSQPVSNGSVLDHEPTTDDKDPEVGTSNAVMNLWEGKSSNDRLIWLTEPPMVKEEVKPVSESPQYTITLLHRPSKETGKHKLDAIIMRGPELRKFLEDTIPNIASYYNETEHGILLRSPFRLLFWHLDQVEAAARGSNGRRSEVTKLLLDVLEEEFKDILAKRKQLIAQQEMNFSTAWSLFKPGITCVTYYVDKLVAVKVVAIDFSRDPMGNIYYRIKYNTLAWDGEYFGWQDSYTDVMEFNGRRKIVDLDIYPVEFCKDADLINQLTSRGKRFAEIAVKEPYMMSFSGEALDREVSPMWWQGEQKKKLSERVVLDARAYNHYYRRLYVTKWMKRDELKEALTKKGADQSIFMYCCPELYCFALRRKKWARIWIDDVDEVVFNESAYPSLVLPNDYKELLLAFAEAQIDGYGFDDVIAGKGQGILMLLAGPPGTGKTLTAEAVAEHMRRPLYSVSAGELGASPSGMEKELDRVLELSTRWNAVLLLDEADVFLERRVDSDLQRNSIVSTFLKTLEYYRGVMFLTTNRISSFDEAFKSRIHVSIRYPDLDTSARLTIWQNFLKRAQSSYQYGVDISSEEAQELSQRTLNGREIRNIVKSAQLMASRSKQTLQKKHLDLVWKVEHENSAWEIVDGK